MTKTFEELNLPKAVLENLKKMGYVSPTEIQQKVVPSALNGKDILASSKTGSGKTAAFGIPLIANIIKNKSKGLILAPTRELAAQIKDTIMSIIGEEKIFVTLVLGGADIRKQAISLKRFPEVIIATPGRLKDHIDRRNVDLKQYNILVLDEFDRMLEMGFAKEISKVVSELPKERQTFMFSATTRKTVLTNAKTYLKEYEEVILESAKEDHKNIEQKFLEIHHSKKYDTAIEHILACKGDLCIIFVNQKYKARELANDLRSSGHAAKSIHGDLTQRERTRAVEDFKSGDCTILIATDVVARGLDVPGVKLVINYDMPKTPEDYTHRIGRTGRADATGISVSFVTPEDRKIHHAINSKQNSDEFQPEFRAKSGGRNRGFNGSFRGGEQSNFNRRSSFNRENNSSFGERNFNKDNSYSRPEGNFNRRSEGENRYRNPENRGGFASRNKTKSFERGEKRSFLKK